jgi:hypothetical protein
MMKKKRTTKTSKTKSRSDIEQQFVDMESVVLRMTSTEAIIRNQRLILETILDLRDVVLNHVKHDLINATLVRSSK